MRSGPSSDPLFVALVCVAAFRVVCLLCLYEALPLKLLWQHICIFLIFKVILNFINFLEYVFY